MGRHEVLIVGGLPVHGRRDGLTDGPDKGRWVMPLVHGGDIDAATGMDQLLALARMVGMVRGLPPRGPN